MPAGAPPSGEVVARSFIEQGKAVPIGPDQKQQQDLADRIQQRLDAKPKDPKDALKPQRQPFTFDKDQMADKHMDRTKGTADGAKTKNRLDILDHAQKGTLVSELNKASNSMARWKLYNEVSQQVLDSRPGFAGLDRVEKHSIVEGMLANPDTQAKITAMLEGKLSPDAVGDTEIQNAKDALQAAEDQLAEAKAAERTLTTDFKENSPAATPPSKGDQLKALVDAGAGSDATKAAIDAQRDGFKAKYQALKGAPAAAEVQRQLQLEQDIRAGRTPSVKTNAAEVATMTKLLQMEDDYAQFQQLQSEKDGVAAKAGKVAELTTARDEAATKVTETETAKENAEKQFQKDIQEMMGKAVGEQLDVMIDQRVDDAAAELTKMATEASTEDEKTMAKALLNRLNTKVDEKQGFLGIGKEAARYKLNKDQVKKDFGTIITQGPEAVIQDMKAAFYAEATAKFPVPPNTQAQYLAEVARIDKQFADKAFVDKMSPVVAKNVVRDHILAGGKISTDEARILFQNQEPWAQDLVKQAITDSKAVFEDLKGLDAAQILKNPNYLQRVGKKSGLLFLLMALGGAAVFGRNLKDAFK